MSDISLNLAEIEQRIAAIRENLTELEAQATAYSGAADEERASQRIADQEATARLSTRGQHIVAERGGHWIPLDEPELVVQAVREVVRAARQHSTN